MKVKVILSIFLLCFLLSCSNDTEDQDMVKPTIDMNSNTAFPQNCVVVYRGESFSFRAAFSDNEELGSYNVEIHNNFDHHSHSTDNVECELGPKKTPVKAFVFNKDFSIPAGKKEFDADNEISVPSDVDTGDYHFMVRVTDKAGWQQLKGVSLKIKDRT